MEETSNLDCRPSTLSVSALDAIIEWQGVTGQNAKEQRQSRTKAQLEAVKKRKDEKQAHAKAQQEAVRKLKDEKRASGFLDLQDCNQYGSLCAFQRRMVRGWALQVFVTHAPAYELRHGVLKGMVASDYDELHALGQEA
ncbi:hypothetical protein N7519_008050 [Penicillium mononematosum]|uniref:uncharacterized protein n=1 Tax=Penicillium mononematosum TaxID=268346 RepID=UPI0025469A05|nr:uncharacterized protein N7519_008050 [Penicillium mononematosum]KAJ6186749.1 hypothetical protein N7519_008050 [Penicillium mononematosum]